MLRFYCTVMTRGSMGDKGVDTIIGEQLIAFKYNEYINANVLKIKKAPLHFHPNAVQIILILEGTLYVKQAFEISKLNKGQFTFINQNDVHTVWSDVEPCIVELVSLNIECLKSQFQILESIKFRNTPFKGKDFKIKEISKIREKTFKRYLIELLLQSSYDGVKESGLNELIVRLINLAVYEYNYVYYIWPDSSFISHDKIERFQRNVGYVKSNFTDNILLEKIASQERVGKTYFTQMWKEMIDLSFGEYVNYERTLYSERLLLFTDKTIMDISEDCGFSDVKYFYKNFKNWYSKKPIEWKKDWLGFKNKETETNVFELSEAREYAYNFFKEYLLDTKLDTRIYEQYLMLKEMAVSDSVYNDVTVVFDLFSPENLSDRRDGEVELPEWSAIDLFINEVLQMGLELKFEIRYEALKVPALKDGFEYIIAKSEQYLGLKQMRSWEFEFRCQNQAELHEAKSYVNILGEKLTGAKIKYILL